MKYYVSIGENKNCEVTKQEYVMWERLNGFYNTLGQPDEPATMCFGGLYGSGRMEYETTDDMLNELAEARKPRTSSDDPIYEHGTLEILRLGETDNE